MRKKSKNTIWDCLNTILNEGCYCPTVDNNFFNDELNRISNTVEENLSKLDKEKENGIVKIKIKSPNLNLDKEFKLNAKESFDDVEKEFRNIFGEELKNKGMKDIIEKVDKKNKLNEKNILKNDFNSDFVDFLEKILPITEENKIEGKITCCKDCDESQCVGNCCKVGVITNEVLRKRIFNGEKLEDIFDKVGEWENGVACVKHNGLNNLINTKLQLISDEWFDECHLPKNGFSVVKKDYQYNYINTEGKILSHSQWFDYVGTFSEGFAWVHLDEKGYNYINQNGDILSPNQWFDNTDDFREGFARVELNGKYNFINTEGKLLSPNKWFDACELKSDNGFFKISLNDNIMWIDKNGKIFEKVTPDDYWRSDNTLDVSENNTQGLNSGNSLNEEEMNENEEGFDWVGSFTEGFARVYSDKKGCNLINQNGDLLSPNQWFDNIYDFYEGFARVYLDGKGWNFINQNGDIAFPNQWFDNVYSFRKGFAVVYLEGKGYNFINQNGEYLSPNQWFDDVEFFCEGFARVELNGKYNFINAEGKLLSPNKWFDECGDFENGLAEIITSDGGVMFIDENGNFFEHFTPNNDWRKEKEYLKSDVSLNEEEVKETEEEMIEQYNPTYQLFDSGGIYNPMFYNAVHYICETVHFPLSDIYRFEEKIELDELDGVILIPNVWGKLIDGEIEYFGEYIKNGGKVYVIDPNSFELTLVDSFSKLWDYAMTTTQMECL